MQSSSRGGARVRLLAIHTTEGIMRATDLRAWKSWPGSAHASADQYGNLLDGAAGGFVDYDKAAWTLRSGNAVSDNLELCALASWTRADWMARPKLLELAAVWLARRTAARPWIPLVKLTPAQVRAGAAGVIGHVDWTEGMKDGTHWDPGKNFPWDVVIPRAIQIRSGLGNPAGAIPTPEDDMPLNNDDLNAICTRLLDWEIAKEGGGTMTLSRFLRGADAVTDATRAKIPYTAWPEEARNRLLTDVAEQLDIATPDIAAAARQDPAAVAAALLPGLVAALPAHGAVTQVDVEAALRNVLRAGVDPD